MAGIAGGYYYIVLDCDLKTEVKEHYSIEVQGTIP